MKTLATLVPLACLVAVAAAEDPAVPADRPAEGTRRPDLSALATPLTFTCELQDIYLTRSIGVSSADSSTRHTGSVVTGRTTTSTTTTDSMEHSRFETSGSSSERSKRDSWQVSAEGGVGLKWGIVPTASGSFGGNASRTVSSENRESRERGETARTGGSVTTSASAETTRSDSQEDGRRKTDETRRGDYKLVLSVRLRNTDTTDTLVIDLSKAKAKIGGPGLTGVLSVPCREQGMIDLGVESTVCIFEEAITDERQLEDLLRLQAKGDLPRLRLMASGADFPVVSEKTGKNVLSEQAETERRRPGTRIAIEFGELQDLSPWRVSRRHTTESGTRGTPVTLREALLSIGGAACKQSDSLPETVFSFSKDGTLRRVIDRPLLEKSGTEDYRMFAVRLTKEKNGAMETEVRLPLAPTMDRRIVDCSEITLIEFSFSEFARAAVLASAYFAPLRKEIEDYLAETDKAALSVWKKRFDDAQREDDESDLPENSETITALDVERYRQRAEAGIPNMQYKLAQCLCHGWGADINLKESGDWCRMAANQGHAKAQFNLGICYVIGAGVEQDMTKAGEWFLKAAEQGLAESQIILGGFYENGVGIEKNMAKAVEWYRKAAEQGAAEAQCCLGWCYENGEGIEKSMIKAVEWYRKAAEQGFAEAQYRLGLCYETGGGAKKNMAKAVEWYRKAAEQGVAAAQNNLGWCYENGEGVEKNTMIAVEWYRKAAEQGVAEAQNNLGWCYENGEGVEKNNVIAVEWYRKAAEQGLSEAQKHLGYCYSIGKGVKRDKEKAIEWVRKAAEQGDEEAKKALKRLER